MPHQARPESTPAYHAGGLALALSLAAILIALGYEHLGGLQPCPLCLQQRYAYYAGIPTLFAALVLVSADWARVAALLFLLVALAFLANAGLAVYQAGAEWRLWPGPDTCDVPVRELGSLPQAGSLLQALETTRVVRCDVASWRFLGLSFAGWNAVVSLLILGAALRAAAAAFADRHRDI